MLSYILALFTWRKILALYILLNIKNFPLAWELRLIYRMFLAWKSKKTVAKLLNDAAKTKSSQETHEDLAPRISHPLFAPVTMTSYTSMLETDHNLHKSNSTYFSDIDESRTGLMTHLLSSTRFSPKELDEEGYKGRFSIVLGSVHTSFLKEIKPYETYTIRSRVLGWDRKWIIIGSYFVTKRKISSKEGKTNEKDDTSEVLLACCLSKYVVKKGRYTVPPERSFRSAGWLPDRPADATDSNAPPSTLEMSQVGTPDRTTNKATESAKDLVHDIAARAAEKLKQEQQKKQKDSNKKVSKEDEDCRAAASQWSWEEIDKERARGIRLVEQWMNLDKELKEECVEEMAIDSKRK